MKNQRTSQPSMGGGEVKRYRRFLAIAAFGVVLVLFAVLVGVTAASPASGVTRTPLARGTDRQAAIAPAESCHARTRDGLNLYFASRHAGGIGGLDIWVSQRMGRGDAFAQPIVLREPVNSRADDYCPAPMADGWVVFLSTRPNACTGAAVYVTRRAGRGWQAPARLGCTPD